MSPLGCLEDLSMATGGGGSLPLFLSILTSSPVALDLSAQADALKFVGNLFTGMLFNPTIYAINFYSTGSIM